MSKQVKLRRGTTAEMGAFTGAQGELCYDEEKEKAVLHDGKTRGGMYLLGGLLPITAVLPSRTVPAGGTASGDLAYPKVTDKHAVLCTVQGTLAQGAVLQVSVLSADVLRWTITNTTASQVTLPTTSVVLLALA